MSMSLCCPQHGEDTPEERERGKAIERLIKQDRDILGSEVKLLLLGAGQSGKSTLAKQMKILYLNGFSEEEKIRMVDVIYMNLYTWARELLEGVTRSDMSLTPATKVCQ